MDSGGGQRESPEGLGFWAKSLSASSALSAFTRGVAAAGYLSENKDNPAAASHQSNVVKALGTIDHRLFFSGHMPLLPMTRTVCIFHPIHLALLGGTHWPGKGPHSTTESLCGSAPFTFRNLVFHTEKTVRQASRRW